MGVIGRQKPSVRADCVLRVSLLRPRRGSSAVMAPQLSGDLQQQTSCGALRPTVLETVASCGMKTKAGYFRNLGSVRRRENKDDKKEKMESEHETVMILKEIPVRPMCFYAEDSSQNKTLSTGCSYSFHCFFLSEKRFIPKSL